MPTVHCDCGEPIHYSVDKVGLIARCRCGRPVRLPEPKPKRSKRHRRPPTQEELFDHEQRAADVRRQILAVVFAVVVILALVFVAIRSSAPKGEFRRQATPSEGP